MTPVPYQDLVAYWLGELDSEREAQLEEQLFEDPETARRLQVVARIGEGIRAVVHEGKLQSGLTVETLEAMEREGLSLRTYRVRPGETVPCTIAQEDFVVIRLQGGFEGEERLDVVMDGTFEGQPPASEPYQDVAVDRSAGEVVLVYPGDRIRALPRSHFCYRVSADGGRRDLGEFRLDHRPP